MDKCFEDEDNVEEENYKCPYCSQAFISLDDVINHMETKHLIVTILYMRINCMCYYLC